MVACHHCRLRGDEVIALSGNLVAGLRLGYHEGILALPKQVEGFGL